ncbi:MAG: M15 family metallopeptidase [bacterium]|nr:M15 family metallopeptidase [bacterium]
MSHYGGRSLTRLRTGHSELQTLYSEVDIYYPHTILEVKRLIEQQAKNVANGVSKTMESKHLLEPAEAVDAAPDPLRWPEQKDDYQAMMLLIHENMPQPEGAKLIKLIAKHSKEIGRWYHFAGYVLATADQLRQQGRMTRKIRQGVDWNGNKKFEDQSFDDLPHTELL